jgi:hypothetical protein
VKTTTTTTTKSQKKQRKKTIIIIMSEEKKDDIKRPSSPNPFSNFLPSNHSPNVSPRSNNGTPSISPRSPRDAMLLAASPPKFATIDQFMTASKAVQDMALAHEISVNQNFKLEKLETPTSSLEKQIHETVHKAFWDMLKEDFEKQPVDYKHTLVIINEAKQGLMSLLLPNHVKFKEQIDSILDMELIKQQMNNDTFNYQDYSRFIIDSMSKLCAPARDSVMEDLRKIVEPVELFKYLKY